MGIAIPENTKISILIIKKHINNIILFFIMINIIAILSFWAVFTQDINNKNSQVTNNIIEYQEVDNEELCRITNCKRVIDKNKEKVFIMNNNHLKIDTSIDLFKKSCPKSVPLNINNKLIEA